MNEKRQLGERAEAQALVYLRQHGLILLDKNYRCRRGEIDLIMQDGATVVFVEVRRRKNHAAAVFSIDEHKQRRLRDAAALYLSRDSYPPDCRFDAVVIDDEARVQWIQNAFDDG